MFDEADLRIPVHVLEALKEGHTLCVVISSDTNVIVTLLYHMKVYMYVQYAIQELWDKAGVGDTTRIIPLHTLFQQKGTSLCNVLPVVHSLTGTGITSKVGT